MLKIFNAHDTFAGNSSWNPAPETRTGFQREFPARVATKFVLVSSASFERENMTDDEDGTNFFKFPHKRPSPFFYR